MQLCISLVPLDGWEFLFSFNLAIGVPLESDPFTLRFLPEVNKETQRVLSL